MLSAGGVTLASRGLRFHRMIESAGIWAGDVEVWRPLGAWQDPGRHLMFGFAWLQRGLSIGCLEISKGRCIAGYTSALVGGRRKAKADYFTLRACDRREVEKELVGCVFSYLGLEVLHFVVLL